MSRIRRRLSLTEISVTTEYCHRRSLSDSMVANATNVARLLKRQILANARHHLRDYPVSQQVTAERFAPFLPHESDGPKKVALFHKWVTAPLLVTDGELQQILAYEATGQSALPVAPLTSRQSYCYFRSWPMEKWQLERIMQSIRADGYSFEAFSSWSFILHHVANSAIVTPRYVGSTSRQDPRKRAIHQGYRGATSFVEKFEAKLVELFPTLSCKGVLHLIKHSALFYVNTRLAVQSDLYEGWMISFFHPASLLNRQRGGINPSFLPSHQDVCTFLKCRTTLLAKISTVQTCIQKELTKQVRSLFRPLESLIYAITRGAKSRHYIDSYMDRIAKQATPVQIGRHNMVVFCGLQTTKTSLDEEKGFFDGSTTSAHLSRTILEILATNEDKNNKTNLEGLRSILSFNNVFHWIGDEIKQGDISSNLFHQWLWLVKPFIIVTLGKEAVGFINTKAGNPRIDSLVRAVGRARVVNEGSAEEAILIPLIHPGYDKRSQQSPLQRRVFLLPYMTVWVYLDIALEAALDSRTSTWSRHEVCQWINEVAERKLQEAGFYEELEQASEQLLMHLAITHPISHKAADESKTHVYSKMLRPFHHSSTDVSDVFEVHFSDCALYMKIFFEGIADSLHVALGEPHSRERRRQIKSLYSKNIPSLVTYLDNAHREAWTDFMMGQPKDCSLVACVEALETRARMPPSKVKLLRLYGCNDIEDFEDRRTALFTICADFSHRQTEWIKWMKRRGPDKISSNVKYGQPRDIHVHVSLSGTLTICGMVGGVLKKALIKHRAIASKVWLDKRTAEFDLKRIIIRDGHGYTLHSVKRQLCVSDDLRLLWDYVLGSNNTTTLPSRGMVGSLNQTPKSELYGIASSVGTYDLGLKSKEYKQERPGKPPLKQNQRGTGHQNSPPEKCDALWLINQFLNQRFPDGGLFWTGDPAIFTKSTADLQAFQSYLRNPEQVSHPWSKEWLDILDKPRGLVTFSASLKWLREVQTSSQNATTSMSYGDNAFRPKCSVYKLGPKRKGW